MVEKSRVEKFMVEKSGVKKSGVEKSGVEMFFNRIKVSQIECSSLSRAKPDCDQWITGVSGQVTSYNWANVQLQNKDYTYCIRRELGMYTCTVIIWFDKYLNMQIDFHKHFWKYCHWFFIQILGALKSLAHGGSNY